MNASSIAVPEKWLDEETLSFLTVDPNDYRDTDSLEDMRANCAKAEVYRAYKAEAEYLENIHDQPLISFIHFIPDNFWRGYLRQLNQGSVKYTVIIGMLLTCWILSGLIPGAFVGISGYFPKLVMISFVIMFAEPYLRLRNMYWREYGEDYAEYRQLKKEGELLQVKAEAMRMIQNAAEQDLTEFWENGGLHKDYWEEELEIWRIIRDGRADTFRDAINILEREKYTNEIRQSVDSLPG